MTSRRNDDSSEVLFDPIVAPSGMFSCDHDSHSLSREVYLGATHDQSAADRSKLVYNPMPLNVEQAVQDQVPISDGPSFLDAYKGVEKHKLCDRTSLDDYTATLLGELVPSLLGCNHDAILFPLRGCRQPGIVTKVLAGIAEERLVVFNYTYAKRDSQQNPIRQELSESLQQKISDRQITSVGVIDTAIGGYGSEHLAKILSSLHDELFGNQHWSVQFHLLHQQGRVPELSRQIPKYSRPTCLMLWPMFYAVEDLILEDWSEGIGLSYQWQGEHYELKRCIEPGKVLVRDEESIQVIESASLSETMTSMFVDSVNRQMIGNDDYVFLQDVLDHDGRPTDGRGE
ncbi:MAG: hypothetical protein NXI28_23785 [bacterium]|mgnify:CR=1 FL=1|nr:hypothetical protein [bacterium]